MVVLRGCETTPVTGLILLTLTALLLGVLACGQESAPDKSDPAAYAQHLVSQAMERYQKDGFENTVAYLNSDAGKDGEWYVFMVHSGGELLATADQELVGENMNGDLGTDPSGYNFWLDMRDTTSQGKWLSYTFLNPETREQQPKHSWVARDGDLFFGSGWYEGIK